jgi:phycobilisome core component
MKEMVKAQVEAAGLSVGSFLEQPFDYMIRELSEQDI